MAKKTMRDITGKVYREFIFKNNREIADPGDIIQVLNWYHRFVA